jgi:hypothetical protein
MSYSNFTFEKVREQLELTIEDRKGLFSHVEEANIDDSFLLTLFKDNIPLALAINTEKARSELIIMPVLLKIRKMFNNKISLFSGVDFTVNEEIDLKGVCDFLISLSPEQFFISAPVVTIVEAKKENIVEGIPACMAEMKAAQIFNKKRDNEILTIYGSVTSGSIWKFMSLNNNIVSIDLDEYYIKEISKILGILFFMCQKVNFGKAR